MYLLILVLGGTSAHAAEVYLNGVKVTGAIQNRAFQGVDVQFNAQGNVYINAPGYEVKLEGGKPTVAASKNSVTPTAQKAYWIVLRNRQVGHYRIMLKVNGAKVGDVPSTRRQFLVNITERLHSGKNEVEIVYLPIPDAPKSGQLDGTEVLVGQGQSGSNGALTLSKVLGTHKHKTGSRSAEAAVIPIEIP